MGIKTLEYGGVLVFVLIMINWAIAVISLLVAMVYSLRIAKLARWATTWKAFAFACVLSIFLSLLYALTWSWGGIEPARVAVRDFLAPAIGLFFFYGIISLYKDIMRVRGG